MTKEKDLIHIAIAADNNFSQHLCVTLVSIFSNLSPERQVNVYVLDGGITKDNVEKIRKSLAQFGRKINNLLFINFSLKEFSNFQETKGITRVTYYRIRLPALLPNVSKVLYFDSDIVVVADIGELYDADITDTYVMAAQDSSREVLEEGKELGIPDGNGYFNAGVMLMNLDKFRTDGIPEKVIAWLERNNHKNSTHDQSALNVVLTGGWKPMNPRWNQLVGVSIATSWKETTYTKEEFDAAIKHPKVIHYSSRFAKPWKFESISPHKNVYYKYLAMSEFSDYQPTYTLKSLVMKVALYVYFRILPSSAQNIIKKVLKGKVVT
jgi:lipopolysaccharide biosynthesis glycosyltransferase